jgi:DNA-binding transcriptional regulator YdaS (Cro superfamily)
MDTRTLLKILGGQAAVARECDISESAVSQWVDESWIPPARLMYLRLAHPGCHWDAYTQPARKPEKEAATHGQVRCEDLRPDVNWGVLRGTAAPEQKEVA